MSASQEDPELIQYKCERCKTRFVPPPSRLRLGLLGEIRVVAMGIGRTLRHHEVLGAGHGTARRQLFARMDDEAFRSFVQRFRFCQECRQFVCNECWSTSRGSCLTCVAKSMSGVVRPRRTSAPKRSAIPSPAVAAAPPRRGRLRRDATLVALAVAIFMLVLEGGVLLAASSTVNYG